MLVMGLEAVAASEFNSEVAKTMQMLERHNCGQLQKKTKGPIESSAVNVEQLSSKS
jgi:hypothetical protein